MSDSNKFKAQITVWKTTRDKARALCKKLGISYNILFLISVDLIEQNF